MQEHDKSPSGSYALQGQNQLRDSEPAWFGALPVFRSLVSSEDLAIAEDKIEFFVDERPFSTEGSAPWMCGRHFIHSELLTSLEAWVCALQGILHLNKIIKFLKTIM
jgi:hypothetical protein